MSFISEKTLFCYRPSFLAPDRVDLVCSQTPFAGHLIFTQNNQLCHADRISYCPITHDLFYVLLHLYEYDVFLCVFALKKTIKVYQRRGKTTDQFRTLKPWQPCFQSYPLFIMEMKVGGCWGRGFTALRSCTIHLHQDHLL